MTQFYRHGHPVFPETRRIRGPFFTESNQKKSGVGWHWWEEETAIKPHITPLNALHNLHPETQAQNSSKPKRFSRKAEVAVGGSPGRMLGHSPDLPVSQPRFKRQHRKR